MPQPIRSAATTTWTKKHSGAPASPPSPHLPPIPPRPNTRWHLRFARAIGATLRTWWAKSSAAASSATSTHCCRRNTSLSAENKKPCSATSSARAHCSYVAAQASATASAEELASHWPRTCKLADLGKRARHHCVSGRVGATLRRPAVRPRLWAPGGVTWAGPGREREEGGGDGGHPAA